MLISGSSATILPWQLPAGWPLQGAYCLLDRFINELLLNFGGSITFLLEDFIVLPIPKKISSKCCPFPSFLALVFFFN